MVGPAEADADLVSAGEEAGRRLADAGCIVITGGLGGVMAAASRGAREAGGLTVGLLPGTDRSEGNAWLSVTLPTGLGQLRNGLVVAAADVVLALGRGMGTLSEIALALRTGRPVVGFETWHVDGVSALSDIPGAVAAVLELGRAANTRS